MSEHKESVGLGLAWIASLTLGQWQSIVGIGTGVLVGLYTLLRMWVLWRNRHRKDSE